MALVVSVVLAGPAQAGPGSLYRTSVNYADPGYLWDGSKYQLFGTGAGFPNANSSTYNGIYTTTYDSLRVTDLPTWVGSAPDWGGRRLWAPNVIKVGSTYVMYYSAWHKNQGRNCIGIATSAHAVGYYYPYGTPICAPATAGTKAEAIDPSAYISADGNCYMLFKTSQGNLANWKIWAKPMGKNCRTFGSAAKVKIAAKNRMEAPSMVRHGGYVWLFVSRYDYSGCAYNVQVWRASSLWNGTFSATNSKTLLSQKNSGLCGPGGATVINTPNGTRMALHAWRTAHPATDLKPTTGTRMTYTAIVDWTASGWPVVR